MRMPNINSGNEPSSGGKVRLLMLQRLFFFYSLQSICSLITAFSKRDIIAAHWHAINRLNQL